jgi:cytosine/creatinine deaminase
MSDVIPRSKSGFCVLPDAREFIIANCSVPEACLGRPVSEHLPRDADGLILCDVHVLDGAVKAIGSLSAQYARCPTLDLEGGICFPTFVDLHTHIGTTSRYP